MLRAVRFTATLGFTIDPATLAAIRRQASAIRRISAERIREELTRILTSGGARDGDGTPGRKRPSCRDPSRGSGPPGSRPAPGLPSRGGCLGTYAADARPSPRRGWRSDLRLAWAVLLHDVGKPVTRFEDETGVHFYGHVRRGEEIAAAILQRLRFSREETETILALIRGHMLFMNVREMRPNRLKRFLRQPDFPLHLELHRLDCLGSHGLLDNYEFSLQKLKEYSEEELRPPPLLTGEDLIGMGYAPGPIFREILCAVEDAQLGGEIADAGEARSLVRKRWGDPCHAATHLFRLSQQHSVTVLLAISRCFHENGAVAANRS